VHNVPVLGINRGQLGFLTDIKPEELETQLKPILNGAYREEKRFLIEASVKQEGLYSDQGNALNDIVLFPGQTAQLIEFELYIDKQFVYSQRSDGLIISTPTGSTAYSLSAGGPIMQPHLNVLVLVPMFPHTLTSRPIVIDADSEIMILVADFNKTNPRLSYDGQSHTSLMPGAEIKIRKQARPLRLIHPYNHDYYEVLRTKLHWGKQLIPLRSSKE
jgi:NAD+ kinase